jgi:hypothetical protein
LGVRALFKVFGLWNVTEVRSFLHFCFRTAAVFSDFAAFVALTTCGFAVFGGAIYPCYQKCVAETKALR